MSDLLKNIAKQRQEIKSDRMDMSFGEIINMYKDGEILISPEYQRAFRWDVQRETDFIESVLLGIPFPSIFVATNDDGTWELIDGLQRVSTILSFFGELKNSERNNLCLCEGSIIKELSGITIETLPLELKLAIKRTPCRVEIIQKESNFEMRYELFKRLNTGGEGLTRQEIRNCIYRGATNYKVFSDMLKRLANNQDFVKSVYISTVQQQEMMYEELVLRFFALYKYRDNYTQKTIQDFFDTVMKQQSDNPDLGAIESFEAIFEKVFAFFGQYDENINLFRLARLNFSTSMYDALCLSLADYDGDIASINKGAFISAVEELKADEDFKRHAGAASSTASNIREKIRIAKAKLFNGRIEAV